MTCRIELPLPPLCTHCRDANKFKRIAILQGANKGYGFAEPFEFKTLVDLICYYARSSLKKHNPDLETTLERPAFV